MSETTHVDTSHVTGWEVLGLCAFSPVPRRLRRSLQVLRLPSPPTAAAAPPLSLAHRAPLRPWTAEELEAAKADYPPVRPVQVV